MLRIPYRQADVHAQGRYEVRAAVTQQGRLLLDTPRVHPVLIDPAFRHVDVILARVPALQATAAASVPLRQTYWKLVEVVDDAPVDMALVDVAVSDNLFVGSRALWDMSDVSQLFFSRCNPACIGFSAVGGQLDSIRPEEPRGLALDIDPDFACRVRAAIGPGLFADVGVSGMHKMLPGDVIPVRRSPCTLALDGEREVEVRKGQRAGVRLSDDWLRVVDVQRTLEYARQRGLFMRGAQVCYSR